MEIRELSGSDVQKMWEINEQGLPGTGKVDEQGLLNLLEYSEISVGAYKDGELLGYVICLPPATEYGSLNYAWFNENMSDFLYVDRIAVAQIHRDKGIGSSFIHTLSSTRANKLLPKYLLIHQTSLACAFMADLISRK